MGGVRRHRTGDEPWPACADFCFVGPDIISMSLSYPLMFLLPLELEFNF
jgi:hypothetical protein